MRCITILWISFCLTSACTAAEPQESWLRYQGRLFRLRHFVAFEAKHEGEEVIRVIASSKPIAEDRLPEDNHPTMSVPNVMATFKKSTGEAVEGWSAGTNSSGGGNFKGSLLLINGRCTGRAQSGEDEKDNVEAYSAYDVHFNVPLSKKPQTYAEKMKVMQDSYAEEQRAMREQSDRMDKLFAEQEANAAAGRFSLVSLPDGLMKVDTQTGDTWLLESRATTAEWKPVRNPPGAKRPASKLQLINGTKPAAKDAAPPKKSDE